MEPDQPLVIPTLIWRQMAEQATRHTPLETCGLLAGAGKKVQEIYPIRNVLQSRVRFRMDPHEQLKAFLDIEARGLELLAIYHSHPAGPPAPSATDIGEFTYPGVATLIWSPGAAESGWIGRGFQILKDTAEEITIKII